MSQLHWTCWLLKEPEQRIQLEITEAGSESEHTVMAILTAKEATELVAALSSLLVQRARVPRPIFSLKLVKP